MDERTRYWLLELFAQAEAEHFYGEFKFGLRDGHITMARKEQSLLPPDVSENDSRAGAPTSKARV